MLGILKELVGEYNQIEGVNLFLAPCIKLSATYENMQFSARTVTELGKRKYVLNENGEQVLEERKIDYDKVKDLNFAFFRLAEHILEKMEKDNKKTYRFNDDIILKNKSRIMENDNMKELSEFTKKYNVEV